MALEKELSSGYRYWSFVLSKFICFSMAFFVTACSKVSVQDYQGTRPNLDLKQFFDGTLKVYGVLQNRQGVVTRKFTADIDAYWEGEKGYLNETFYFDDGEVDTRNWVLTDLGHGRYSGTAGDVVGQAQGEVSGSAFHWRYVLSIPYKGKSINVSLDDRLYLVADKRLINKTKLKKFGFNVGELTLVIEKQ